MLKKKHKIQRAVFPKIISKGKIFHSPLFTLRVFFDKERGAMSPRISFVVSSKVSKKATDRNILKRRGYRVVRNHLLRIRPGCACVFFLKKDALRASFAELEKEIITSLKRADIFHT